jgi:hypothetical protein
MNEMVCVQNGGGGGVVGGSRDMYYVYKHGMMVVTVTFVLG